MTKDPTNGWTRAEMVDHILHHAHELSGAMAHMPDMAGSELHRGLIDALNSLRQEARENGYWKRSA